MPERDPQSLCMKLPEQRGGRSREAPAREPAAIPPARSGDLKHRLREGLIRIFQGLERALRPGDSRGQRQQTTGLWRTAERRN